jgi:hypothetical protein
VLGGYNPTGWVNLGEYRGSIAAFLFVFPAIQQQQGGGKLGEPIKLQKISGAGLAQIDGRLIQMKYFVLVFVDDIYAYFSY